MAKTNIADESLSSGDSLNAFESKLVNVLALLLVQERQQTEQIDLLNRAGFRPSEIASLIGTTRNTVSVTLSQQKTMKKPKKERK
jgi:hypothetical protein